MSKFLLIGLKQPSPLFETVCCFKLLVIQILQYVKGENHCVYLQVRTSNTSFVPFSPVSQARRKSLLCCGKSCPLAWMHFCASKFEAFGDLFDVFFCFSERRFEWWILGSWFTIFRFLVVTGLDVPGWPPRDEDDVERFWTVSLNYHHFWIFRVLAYFLCVVCWMSGFSGPWCCKMFCFCSGQDCQHLMWGWDDWKENMLLKRDWIGGTIRIPL